MFLKKTLLEALTECGFCKRSILKKIPLMKLQQSWTSIYACQKDINLDL
jgi:hypothetical protein